MAELSVISRTDFSGGIDSSSSPYALKDNCVLRLNNLMLDEQGALYTRDGAVTIDSGQFGTTAILTLYNLVKTDGTVHRLAVRRSPGGQFLNLRGAGAPWPQLGTFATSDDLPTINTFRDRAIIAAGYEAVKSYDGTTFASLTANTGAGEVVPPGAKHMAVHLGSLWLWNTAATTNATDGPSSLRASGTDNPNSWPLENQTFLSNDDGQQGQGLATFTLADTGISPQGVLVAFKDFSTYVISGIFNAVNFNVDKAKTDMGCVAPRSIQFIAGLGIIRLTHRGFAVFDGANDRLISDPIRPYIFGQQFRSDLLGLDFGALHRSTATQAQNPLLYLCVCPVDGGTMTRVFAFDVLRQAWTVLTFPMPLATIDAQFDPGVQPYLLGGELGGGRVVRLLAHDPTDDGVPVPWHVRLQPVRNRAVSQRLYVRRTLLKVTAMSAGQAITGRAIFGPAAQRQGPGQRLSVSTVSTAIVPGQGLEDLVEATLNYDVGRTGEAFGYEFEGQGQVILREIAVQARSKPLSRPMRL